MGAAVGTLTVNKSIGGDGLYKVYGTVVLGAADSTYTTGGVPTSFFVEGVKATQVPLQVNIMSLNGNLYSYNPGADASLGAFKYFTDFDTEQTNAGSLATPQADTINVEIIWAGMW